MWSGLVVFFWVGNALHAVVPPAISFPAALSSLKVAALKLCDRDLLLDKLEEKLLLITNAPP